MITTNHYGRMCYESLEVGDKLAVMTQYVREYEDAKPCEVIKVTAKQVQVKWSDTESISFMRESGRAVGQKGYGADRWSLITLETVAAAKARRDARHKFGREVSAALDLIKGYVGYSHCDSITAEHKQQLLDLISGMKVRSED